MQLNFTGIGTIVTNGGTLLLCCFVLLLSLSSALNADGYSLLALKAAVTHDPQRSLAGWVETDRDPCGWKGVTCSLSSRRVTEVILPEKGLSGYIPSELGFILTLQRLSLPHNNFSNPIPTRLLSITSLTSLDLSGNALTGSVPVQIRLLTNLTSLDLSSNALSGALPAALAELPALAGTLNLSHNHFSGSIPTEFAQLPSSLSLDFRFNNLSGAIPQVAPLLNQGPTAFAGNPFLCGFPLQSTCNDLRPNTTTSPISPTSDNNHDDPEHPTPLQRTSPNKPSTSKFPKLTTLIGAALAAAVVLLVIGVSCLLIRRLRHLRGHEEKQKTTHIVTTAKRDDQCDDKEEQEECCYYSSSSYGEKGKQIEQQHHELRVLDEGFGVELEELLKASAYVVGKSRSGIVYKVVVGKGVAVAVRRLGEGAGIVGREFEAEVEAISRVRHPNLVRLRAYYLAPDERLLVSDFIPNGTLYSALHAGALTTPLPWGVRLKIAQGAARGIAYIHEFVPGKYVHGSIKSSKLLLGEDHQPYVSGFGLAQLMNCTHHSTEFVRKRKNSLYSAAPGLKPSLPSSISSNYSAPEARAGGYGHTQKCDVYAFGIVLLELLSGRLPDASPESNDIDLEGFVRQAFKEERPLSDIVDPLLLHEVYAKKQVLASFHIALGCTEFDPENRPKMKAISECLERIEFL